MDKPTIDPDAFQKAAQGIQDGLRKWGHSMTFGSLMTALVNGATDDQIREALGRVHTNADLAAYAEAVVRLGPLMGEELTRRVADEVAL